MRKRKYQSFLGIGAPLVDEKGDVIQREIASSPKTISGYAWMEAEKERQARDERLAAEQKVRDDATLAENNSRVRDYWSQPVSALKSRPVGVYDPYSGMQAMATEPDAGQRFLAELENEGITLTSSGRQRLGMFCDSQNTHSHGQYGVSGFNLRQAMTKFLDLGIFQPHEISVNEPEPVETDAERRSRRVREVLGESYSSPDIQDLQLAWHDSVRQHFGYTLSATQHAEALRFIQRSGANPLKDGFNRARVNLVHRSLAPPSLLLASDVLQDQLDSGEITPETFWQRSRALALENKLHLPREQATW
jgi:hypothetical protein